MNNENEKGLDDLFKKKLEDPVDHPAAYKEEDWATLEQMLDKHNRRRGIIYWLPILSSAAAILLLVWGWWAFEARPKHTDVPTHLQAANSHQQAKLNTGNGVVKQSPGIIQDKKHPSSVPVNYTNNNNHHTNINRHDVYSKTTVNNPVASSVVNDNGNGQNGVFSRENAELLIAASDFSITEHQTIVANPVTVTDIPARAVNATAIPAPAVARVKAKPAFRPQYALSVLAAPDANGVGSFQQSRLGTNLGMLFSIGLTKKLTISTGALYSIKPYTEGSENYPYPANVVRPATPINIAADCRMLDIPVNVGYQLYNKNQNKISVGTGLSSYIMLHESYTFNSVPTYPGGPTSSNSFTVPNSSKNLFGVLNLNATYERQINSKVGISFEPYLKLPLTDIGYSKVRLQTTGIAVGLTWNLNSLTKP